MFRSMRNSIVDIRVFLYFIFTQIPIAFNFQIEQHAQN